MNRRRRLSVLGLAVVLVLGGCARLPWSEAARARRASEPAPLATFTPTARLQRLWQADAGASIGTAEGFLPAFGAGRVYVADPEGRVSAFDAGSGKRLWRAALNRRLSAAVGLGAGLVLVGTAEGEVVALAAEDGALRWTSRLSSEVLAPPAAADDTVFVRTVDGRLYALSAADGRRRWVYERGVPSLSLRGTAAPVVREGAVVSGFAGGRLVANAVDTGRVLWEVRIAEPRGRSEIDRLADIDGTPAADTDRVFGAAYPGPVAAVVLGTGRTLWRRPFGTFRDLALDARHVYLTDPKGVVVALGRTRGATVWRQEGLRGRLVSGPAVADGYVALVDREGYLHLLSAADGRFAARLRLGGAGTGRPVAAGPRLFVLSADGTLIALGIKPVK